MMNDHHETKSRIGPIVKHHEVEKGIDKRAVVL
jgi:hypothetical protein